MFRIRRWVALAAFVSALVTVVLVVGVAPDPIGAQTVGTGGISGTVSDGTTGIAGVAVRAYDAPTGAFVAKTTTDASGLYTIGGLPEGDYKVLFNGTAANWQIQFYGGSTTMAGATVVPVVAGADATADAVLVAGGGISLDLHNNLGFPTPCLRDVPIRVYDLTGRTLIVKQQTPTVTNTPGLAFLGGLPPGTYLVRVGDGVTCNVAWWSGSEYGVGNRLAAVPVTVAAGQTTSIRVAVLQTATFAGRVTDAGTGAGIEGIDVRLYYGFEDGFLPLGSLFAKTRTGPDGSWSVSNVRASAEAARFSDAAGRYQQVWYLDAATFADASKPIAFPTTTMTMDQTMTPVP